LLSRFIFISNQSEAAKNWFADDSSVFQSASWTNVTRAARWIDINIDKSTDKSTIGGYLTQPNAEGRHPEVVVIQEIWGVNSHIQSIVDRLPAHGYVGLAPSMFHLEGPMTIGLHEELDLAISRMNRIHGCRHIARRISIGELHQSPVIRPWRQDWNHRLLLWWPSVLPGRL
jgi:hypothetical protein